MTSIKQHIAELMQRAGVTIDDVRWVGSYDGQYAITWRQFALLIENYPVNAQIAEDLVIVGDNWWIAVYQLVFCKQPVKLPNPIAFTHLEGRDSAGFGRFLCDDEAVN